jgi:N6-adenosine-specific RNA methylase IME4
MSSEYPGVYASVATPPFPGNSYSVIYADPPWSYHDRAHAGRRGVVYKYPTMTLPELEALPVEQIAAPECFLCLWSTGPQMDVAIGLLKAWGFTYNTVLFDWLKVCRRQPEKLHWGMGHTTRSNEEHVLLGARGRLKRFDAAVHSVIVAPVGKHSAKPAETRIRIERLWGDVPRIELFARERVPGWDAWGAGLS